MHGEKGRCSPKSQSGTYIAKKLIQIRQHLWDLNNVKMWDIHVKCWTEYLIFTSYHHLLTSGDRHLSWVWKRDMSVRHNTVSNISWRLAQAPSFQPSPSLRCRKSFPNSISPTSISIRFFLRQTLQISLSDLV